MIMMKRGRRSSFTLVELLASAVILSILAVMGVPYAQTAKDRQVELELKESLLKIRSAIDAHAYGEVLDSATYPMSLDGDGVRGEDGVGDPDGDGIADDDWDGRIDEDGSPTLPKTLEDLVKKGYLTHIPRDPLADDPNLPAAWTLKKVKRSFAVRRANATQTIEQEGIIDVASTSKGISLAGSPYSSW
ncbi:MAG: type II secretion system protein [Candidatus Riflebacteria bacterium]|nr:type II secretion system protein [Candidatus Riflebacteria bacterium]